MTPPGAIIHVSVNKLFVACVLPTSVSDYIQRCQY